MDFSSFPHRQVVFRIKTTMVWTSVCSFDFRPLESPTLAPPSYLSRIMVFKHLLLNKTGALFLSKLEFTVRFF